MVILSKFVRSLIKKLPGGRELLSDYKRLGSYFSNDSNNVKAGINYDVIHVSREIVEKSFDPEIFLMVDKAFFVAAVREVLQSPDKSLADAFHKIASYLSHAGLPDEAMKCYEISLNIKPNKSAAIIYLQTLMYTSPEKFNHERIYNITKYVINNIVAYVPPEQKNKKFENDLSENRILNIGYTCHFFNNSTSTTLFLPLLKKHNRDRVKIFIYSDQEPSETLKETEELVDVWHYTNDKSDAEFSEMVRNDKIDILVELNGFCEKNRYGAINMRSAPVQVSFYNLSSTCGAEEMDYTLVGEEVKIDHIKDFYVENIFQKKGIQLATEIGNHFPPIKNELPCNKNNYITFASFNQIHKVSREQVFLWSEVLKAVPNSKFYIKANGFDSSECLFAFKNHFRDAGIDESRIIFEGNSPYSELLKCYEKVDIGLDTYPYGGGTTTIEAVIQGTPVISLVGERFCEQHGYINLHPIGCDELIAYSKKEFVEKAVKLAADKDRLEFYKNNLREKLLSSPRSDLTLYIKDLEDAYISMWKNYINKNSKV